MKLRGNLEDQCEGSKGWWRPCFDCGLKMHSVFKTYAAVFTPKQSGWSETELNGHRRKGWLCVGQLEPQAVVSCHMGAGH